MFWLSKYCDGKEKRWIVYNVGVKTSRAKQRRRKGRRKDREGDVGPGDENRAEQEAAVGRRRQNGGVCWGAMGEREIWVIRRGLHTIYPV